MPWPLTSPRQRRLGAGLIFAGAAVWVAASLWSARSVADGEADGAAGPVWPAAQTAAAPAVAPGTGAAGAASNKELVQHLKRQPRDGRALVFKARLDVEAEHFDLAVQGYAEALRVTPRVARDPGVWVEYAEARALAQGGSLIGEPEQLLQRALDLDGRHAQALDLAGSAAWERRHYAQAAALWQRLLVQIPAGSERHAALVKAIGRAEMLAKVSLPPGPR